MALLLKNGLVLHLDPTGVERADIRVQDGRLAEVGPGLAPIAGDTVRDIGDSWVLPGLVCGHHHLYSALSGGMPLPAEKPRSFADMLAQVWWKLDRALDEESVFVSAQVGGLAALRAGVTTVVDHHSSPNFIDGSLECLDRALGGVGVRRVLCYEITDRGGPREAEQGLLAHEGLLTRPKDGFTAAMVGAHAGFTLSDATLAAAADLATSSGTGLHIHVAESTEDQESVGEPLISRMRRLGALVPGSLLAHCVHLTSEDLALVYDAGAWVSHQARSNMNNHVGYAPVSHFAEHTILGTDGIGADMFAESQIAYFRAREGSVPWSPDRFLRALAAGATFAGLQLGTKIGRIEAGYEADLIVADIQPGPPLSAGNLAGAFLFRFNAGMVRHVMIGGDWKLWDRQPVSMEPEDVEARAHETSRALWKRVQDAPTREVGRR
jgi:putative selenium metabolism protein SsnA